MSYFHLHALCITSAGDGLLPAFMWFAFHRKHFLLLICLNKATSVCGVDVTQMD